VISSVIFTNQLLESPPLNSYHAKYFQQKPNQKNQPTIKKKIISYFSRAIQGSSE
jgi:hypothetical protein